MDDNNDDGHNDDSRIKSSNIIIDSVDELLHYYDRSWNYTEVNGLIFLGPLISMLAKYKEFENYKMSPLKIFRCAYN